MKGNGTVLAILTASFTVLMSLPFLVPHMGVLALVGLVPLLMMDVVADTGRVRRFWLWYSAAFFLWNFCTTFWVCNATVGGGIFASVANAFQMSVIFALFRLSKKRFSGSLSYVFLAAAWIAWERFYFNAEISWPWLTLGNAFARSTSLVQWYEFTGTLGGSLWVWASNLLVFHLLAYVMGGQFGRLRLAGKAALAGGTAAALLLPVACSLMIASSYAEDKSESVDVVIGQPDFDPYQKFQSLTQAQQNAIYLDLLEKAMAGRDHSSPVLFLAPETFTNDIVLQNIEASPTYDRMKTFLESFPGSQMLFGASSYSQIISDKEPSPNARRIRDDLWYESYNSAVMVSPGSAPEVFHKSKLVVGVEKMPYPKLFSKIDRMLGGVMGHCSTQDSVSLLHYRGIPLGCAICYESVYGEYCTEYVRKGARALTVITNDAWWGNTPGYRQHLSYSCLRAIETRRSIARCANTGISAIIDQKGNIVSETQWWQPAVLEGRIYLNDSETFFVRHGDITGRVCTFLFLLLFLAAIVRKITGK